MDEKGKKNPAAVALGKLGGAKGGAARAKKLSAKKRSEIARKGALALARKLSPKERRQKAQRAIQARWNKAKNRT